jgi:predicted nucleic acid-binding protein
VIGPVIVLDAGVLDMVSGNRRFRTRLDSLVAGGWRPLVPTVVLAQAITGRAGDAVVNRLLKQIGTIDTTEVIARRAGQLRFDASRSRSRHVPSGIDAIVAAHAVQAGSGVVFTTDPTDLRRLLANHPNVVVEKP